MVNINKYEFDTEVGAGLFVLMCIGVDEAKNRSYRYEYSMPKKVKKKYEVEVCDFGE